MTEAEGRYERVSGLADNSNELLAALALLAPDGNVRVAVCNVIDFLADCPEDAVVDKRIILEIIARGIVYMSFSAPAHDDTEGEEFEDMSELSAEDAVTQFRKQLGLEEEDVD